tara:strand:+ start:363 stop:800 length:438 start_codon:yes stop_codon:yes gene_type:complete
MNIESVNNDNLDCNSQDTTKIINLGMKKEEILKSLLNILGITYDTIDEIHGKDIDRDLLLENDIVKKLMILKPAIRNSGYKSGKLTSLHKNNESHQKFPGINMVRQVLKCNGYKLHPYVISLGYDQETGKKLTMRKFNIHKFETD